MVSFSLAALVSSSTIEARIYAVTGVRPCCVANSFLSSVQYTFFSANNFLNSRVGGVPEKLVRVGEYSSDGCISIQ
jgi:hypothetical protein